MQSQEFSAVHSIFPTILTWNHILLKYQRLSTLNEKPYFISMIDWMNFFTEPIDCVRLLKIKAKEGTAHEIYDHGNWYWSM